MPYPAESPVAKHDLTWARRPSESTSLFDQLGFRSTSDLFQALQGPAPTEISKICSVYSYRDAPIPPLSRNLLVIGMAQIHLSVVRKLIGESFDSGSDNTDDAELPSCLKRCRIAVKRADGHYGASLIPKDMQNSDSFKKFCNMLRQERIVAVLASDKYNRFGILTANGNYYSDGERSAQSFDFYAHVHVGKVDEVKQFLSQCLNGRPTSLVPRSPTQQRPSPAWQPNTPPIDEAEDGLWQPPASNTDEGLWQPPGANNDTTDISGLWQPPVVNHLDHTWRPSAATTENHDSKRKRTQSDDADDDMKFHANSGAAAADAFYSGLTRTLDTRADSRIYHMRAFNGWVKATQIQELDPKTRGTNKKFGGPLRVLDLACGKGGDLGKWILHPRGVSNYVGIDVARGSLKDAAIRVRTPNMRQKLKRCTFICADLGADVPGRLKSPNHKHPQKLLSWSLQSEPRNASLPPEFHLVSGGGIAQDDRFDVVSIQFAIHYMMSSRQRARRFFQTVSELLEVGGNLIATTIDARVVLGHMLNLGQNLHFDNPAEDLQDDAIIRAGNGACQIRFSPSKVEHIFKNSSSNNSEDLFGLEYTFTLVEGSDHEKGVGDAVNLPEWLTPLPALTELAREAGFELEYAQNFHEFYALRSDPVANAAAHSSLYNMKVLNRNGSIAPDEWEISRLYVAIKFRKVQESSITLDEEEESEDLSDDVEETAEVDAAIKAKLLPIALMKAKRTTGDGIWSTLSGNEKTRLIDLEVRKLALGNPS